MLLFIGLPGIRSIQDRQYFNTSHVTVYLHRTKLILVLQNLFQYISCYCLSLLSALTPASIHISIHLMLLFIHFCFVLPIFIPVFQYISCYCLSQSEEDEMPAVYSFQYISCYCLSILILNILPSILYFNTSHVTVYPFSQTIHIS